MNTAVCPGCDAAALPAARASARADTPTHALLLPGIHCLNCIRGVEAVLMRQSGIVDARVNLSRKRAAIVAAPQADPSPWISALAAAGFEAHEAKDETALDGEGRMLLRLGIAGFAMMNVMLLSVAVWSGATDATRDIFHWIAAAIALPAALFCAEPFFTSARKALSAWRLNMDVPISLAILLACGMSLFETMAGGEHAYFDAALSLTFFLLAGRVLEVRMRSAARSAAADLAALEPKRITCLVDGQPTSRALEDVAVGDTLWITAGARIPVDAVLLDDAVEIDRSAITGESDPLRLTKGARLIAGDVALTGPITVRADAVGAESTLRRMIDLASQAETSRSRYTSLADKAAALYAPLVHGLSFAAFLGWAWATSDVHRAAMIAIATLIITCPCALGLAVPAVSTVATGRLFRAGTLVKSDTALERLAEIDTIVFDKTGTLTEPALAAPADLPHEAQRVLRALAEASNHPLARSLLPNLEEVSPAALTNLVEHAGKGVSATWRGHRVRLGAAEWIGAGQGTVLAVGESIHELSRSESLRADAADAIQALLKEGYDIALLTGDTEAKAQGLRDALGITSVHAGMTPEAKLRFINDVQSSGQKALMVGDGLNDTLALTAAWASIAPGSALDVSRNTADVVLLSGRLSGIPEALRVAKSARRRILENFGLAAMYNTISIPLALAGLATPLLAALAMSTSSILVTLNAMRVRQTS